MTSYPDNQTFLSDDDAESFYCFEIFMPEALNVTTWSQMNQVRAPGLLKAENFAATDLLYFSYFWTVFTLVRSSRNIAAKSRREIHHVFNKQYRKYFAGGLYRVYGHDDDPAVCAGKHHGHFCRQRQVLGTGTWQSVGINPLSL